jgi:histidinol-phosphate aminotransferase
MTAEQRDADTAREHPGRLATAAVQQIAPYVPGKPIEELQRELGLKDIIKLASNENPYGPSPRALEAMRAAAAEVGLYPDGSGYALKTKLAQWHGVQREQITLGNGSNDALVLLAEAFLTPQLEAVFSQYAFAVYPIAVQATGATMRVVPALPASHPMALGHDLAAMLAAITPATRLVFVANPNNPTGTYVSAAELHAFIARVPPTALVVLDEAYFEYGRSRGLQDGIEWLGEFSNLVVVRTFAKAYGLAGARVGYAVSHPEVADMLNRVRQSFNVSTMAMAGAAAAIDDQAHVDRAVRVAVAERVRVATRLADIGIRVAPSAGNFLLAHFGGRAAAINQALLQRGIIVRPVANYGLAEHLRITLGTPEQNDLCVAALAEILHASRAS